MFEAAAPLNVCDSDEEKAGEMECRPKVENAVGLYDWFPQSGSDSDSEEWVPEKEGEAAVSVFSLWGLWPPPKPGHWDCDINRARVKAATLREIQIFLMLKGECTLINHINSIDDLREKAHDLWEEFEDKNWFLVSCLLFYDDFCDDEYRLLCLRIDNPDERDLQCYNEIASSFESDLAYGEFFFMLHGDIKWDDSDEKCLEKAKKHRDASMPFMDEKLLRICAEECKKWSEQKQFYEESVNLLVELFKGIREKKKNFPSKKLKKMRRKKKINIYAVKDVFYMVLRRIGFEKRKCFPLWMKDILDDLNPNVLLGPVRLHYLRFLSYLKDHSISKEETKNNLQFHASKFSEMMLMLIFPQRIESSGLKPSNYLCYVMKKIKLALELGILKKEDLPDMSERERMLEARLSSLKFLM